MPVGTIAHSSAPRGTAARRGGREAAGSDGGPTGIPAEVPQYYLPLRGESVKGAELVYQAGVLAAATVNFVSDKSGVSTSTRVRRVAQAPEGAFAIDWEKASDSRHAPRGP